MSTPRQLPILFTGPNVRAILDGSKTQTRRVVKVQPADFGGFGEPRWWAPFDSDVSRPANEDEYRRVALRRCPYGQPSDLLYVRETWAPWQRGDASPVNGFPHDPQVSYRADDEDPDVPHEFLWEPFRWRPSIHMPKKLARLWLRVTDVRVERVQDISEDDAVAEGVAGESGEQGSPAMDFMHLWDSINAKRGHPWSANDWIWAISFERCEAP